MGRDKAGLSFRGRTFLEHMACKARELSFRVVLSVKRKREEFSRYEQIEDVKGRGPIAGIYSVLQRFDRVLFVPVDMPMLDTSVLKMLWEASQGYDVTVCEVEGRLQPLVGVYTRGVLPLLEEAIESGDYSIRRVVLKCDRARILKAEDFGWDPAWFLNVNTPEDVEVLNVLQDGGCFRQV